MTLELKVLSIAAIGLYAAAAVEVAKSDLVTSAWTPDKVTALLTAVFAGLALLITALTGLIAVVWKLRVKTVEIHEAVNGINSALLGRVDLLTSQVADLTGRKADLKASEAAHQDVIEKEKLTISKKDVVQ